MAHVFDACPLYTLLDSVLPLLPVLDTSRPDNYRDDNYRDGTLELT